MHHPLWVFIVIATGLLVLRPYYVNAEKMSAAVPNPDSNFAPMDNVTSRRTLPEELRSVFIVPTDYYREKYNDSLPSPKVGLRVGVWQLNIMESEQKCNLTLDVTVEWTDPRLPLRNTSNIPNEYAVAPHSVLEEFWYPAAQVWYNPTSTTTSFEFVQFLANDTLLQWKSWESDECGSTSCVRFSATRYFSFATNANITYKYFPNDKYVCKFHVTAGYLYKEGNKKATDVPITYPSSVIFPGVYKSDLVFDTRIASPSLTRAFVAGTTTPTTITPLNETLTKFDYKILFDRRLDHYIYQVYVPSGFFVLVGWLSMALPVEIAAERVTLCATTLLTATTFYNTAKQTGTVVSQLRALDVWLLGSILFAFLMLCQSIAVLRITRKKATAWKKRKDSYRRELRKVLQSINSHFEKIALKDKDVEEGSHTSKVGSTHISITEDEQESPKFRDISEEKDDIDDDEGFAQQQVAKMAVTFDRLCLILFALGFAICQGIYWNWLLNSVQQKCDGKTCEGMDIDTEEFTRAMKRGIMELYNNYSFAPWCEEVHLIDCS